jgi:hypothetical protein
VICKFLVDPTGYAYSLKESYNYLKSIWWLSIVIW